MKLNTNPRLVVTIHKQLKLKKKSKIQIQNPNKMSQ